MPKWPIRFARPGMPLEDRTGLEDGRLLKEKTSEKNGYSVEAVMVALLLAFKPLSMDRVRNHA